MPQDREPIPKAELQRLGIALASAGKRLSVFANELPDDAVLWVTGKGSIESGLKAATLAIGRLHEALGLPGYGDPKFDTPEMKRRAEMRKAAKERAKAKVARARPKGSPN